MRSSGSAFGNVLPLEFLARYPWRHYLRHTLPRPAGNLGAFLVGEGEAMLLAKSARHGAAGAQLSGWVTGLSPGLGAPTHQPTALPRMIHSRFARTHLAPHRLQADATLVMVVDAGPAYLNLHTVPTGEFSSNGQFLEQLRELTGSILPMWEDPGAYCWEILGGNLRPAQPEQLDAQLIVAGLPVSTVESLLAWGDQHDATVAAIIPAPLAMVGWFSDTFGGKEPLQFLLCRRGVNSHLFTLSDGLCVGLKTFTPRESGAAVQQLEIRREMEAIVWERRPGSNPPLYLWEQAESTTRNSAPNGDLESTGDRSRFEVDGWLNVVPLSPELLSSRRGLATPRDVVPAEAYPLEWAIRTAVKAAPTEA